MLLSAPPRANGVITRAVLFGALAAAFIGCGHAGEAPSLNVARDSMVFAEGSSVFGAGPVAAGGFQFTAHNSGLRSRWPPVIVQVTVTVTNASDHLQVLRALGGNCAVLLRMYEHHVPPRHPAFDASIPGAPCYVPVLRFTLKPGESATLQSAGDGPGIELAPGRYDLAAIVTIVGADGSQRVEVPAGSVRVPPPYD